MVSIYFDEGYGAFADKKIASSDVNLAEYVNDEGFMDEAKQDRFVKDCGEEALFQLGRTEIFLFATTREAKAFSAGLKVARLDIDAGAEETEEGVPIVVAHWPKDPEPSFHINTDTLVQELSDL